MKVEIKNLSCGYRKHTVLENLEIVLETGIGTCVLGPNGIGKSTFFKTLLGQIKPISGDILVDSENISSLSFNEMARNFAYVPQAKGYSYQFSVEDMVMMGRSPYIRRFSVPTAKDREIVLNAIQQLGLNDFLYRKYSELSGGEQQIVLIARAVAQQSKFIIMDEPASNLDFANQKKLINAVKKLIDSGTGIIMASHSPDHAFACCKKTLLFGKNKSFLFGNTEEVITSNILKSAYGVDITILSGKNTNNCDVKACSVV